MSDLEHWPHRWYGVWREMSGYEAKDVPSIHDVKGGNWDAQELAKVVTYLRAGAFVVVTLGVEKSLLGGNAIAGSRSIRTDGVWQWLDTLAYYVETDKVRLPPVFLKHIKSNGYAVPANAGKDNSRLDWPK